MPEQNFDLRQAEELLPEIDGRLRSALECKKQADEICREQARLIERVVRMGGIRINIPDTLALKTKKEKLVARLRKEVEAIQELGCLIKDLDIGLIDFPTRINGREAYLCWRLGETNIRHWHYTDEGFANRKPLDEKTVQARQRRASQ